MKPYISSFQTIAYTIYSAKLFISPPIINTTQIVEICQKLFQNKNLDNCNLAS